MLARVQGVAEHLDMSLSACVTQASFCSSLEQYEPHLPGNPDQTWCLTPLPAAARLSAALCLGGTAACILVSAGLIRARMTPMLVSGAERTTAQNMSGAHSPTRSIPGLLPANTLLVVSVSAVAIVKKNERRLFRRAAE